MPLTPRRAAATAVATLALSIVGALPATASGSGYVRLAHLSPDTPAVDVYLSSPSGAIGERRFDHVGYGVMSQYQLLPTGTYAVAMRMAGSPASTPPALTTQVTVAAGRAYTVAGVGRFAQLGLTVFEDDLSPPPDGTAKVRVIQASVRAPVLDVSTTAGQAIASDAAFATVTPYRPVTPGRWTVQLAPAGGQASTTVQASCTAGNVYSLVVLDAAGGGLKAELRVDAERRGRVPVGGVDTGGGGTAPRERSPGPVLAGLLLGLAGAAALTVLRARRPHRP